MKNEKDSGFDLVPATVIDAGTLVEPLAATMPEVTASKVDAPDEPAPMTKEGKDARDRAGVVFERGYHSVDSDGKPKTDKNGKFYPASKGRPRGSLTKRPRPSEGAGEGERAQFPGVDTNEPSDIAGDTLGGEDRYSAMADAYLQLSYAPMVAYFGADVMPDENEHSALKMPTADLLRRYGARDLHPGAVLAAVACGIFLTKLRKPTVREKWDALTAKISAWVRKLRGAGV